MNVKRIAVMIVVLTCILAVNLSCQSQTTQMSQVSAALARQVINFNPDWKFKKGDPCGVEKAEFDDSSWKQVRLPHDWAITFENR